MCIRDRSTDVLGASMNVYINTKTMKDRETAEKFKSRADLMNRTAAKKADEIFARIEEGLKCQ